MEVNPDSQVAKAVWTYFSLINDSFGALEKLLIDKEYWAEHKTKLRKPQLLGNIIDLQLLFDIV